MNTLKKRPPGRSEEYKEFIRHECPCYVCACVPRSTVPHHMETAGTGLKGSDFSCVPLCRTHHDECHAMGIETFQARYEVNLWHAAARCLITWADGKWAENAEGEDHAE